jgi:type IV secretory pathway ATPase VirB11/archaellum biosynthesis ATPase
MPNELDDKILHEIGFSTQEELKAFLKKLNAFMNTLPEAEKKVLRASLSNSEAAARTFSPDVTPDQLRAFLKSCEPEDAECILIVWGLRSKSKKPSKT